ncbi:MAG: hypothetical protein ACMUJM_11690 [bacterium]
MRLKELQSRLYCSRCEKRFDDYEPILLICDDGIGFDICTKCSRNNDRIIGTSIFVLPKELKDAQSD